MFQPLCTLLESYTEALLGSCWRCIGRACGSIIRDAFWIAVQNGENHVIPHLNNLRQEFNIQGELEEGGRKYVVSVR